MQYYEVNFNGIPGPTHLFSGLAHGNLASLTNEGGISHPKKAALQSLAKIKFLYQKGVIEAIIPPQPRPNYQILEAFGFQGSPKEKMLQVFAENPSLFKAVCSSSSMWTANAATVSPSLDTGDAKVHITPANLKSNFHRSIETDYTSKILRKIFDSPYFSLHASLVSTLSDEGAANHVRLCPKHGLPGIELFVYGTFAEQPEETKSRKFPARQSLEASKTVIALHKLNSSAVVMAQQSPRAIDAGVFHNDVISTGNENFFVFHEEAFANSAMVIEELKNSYKKTTGKDLICQELKSVDLSLEDAVTSYLFNSQIITLPNTEKMILLAPREAEQNPRSKKIIDSILADKTNPLAEVYFFDLNESMKNGGGPACLRLRVVMSELEIQSCNQAFFFSDALCERLGNWIETYYPDSLRQENLLQEEFLLRMDRAFAELGTIFNYSL